MKNIFETLGLPRRPIMLAPLAGVSDIPFRRICQRLGADLTYVEMLSAVAINHRSERTLAMMERHPEENILGVQVTSGSAEAMYDAVRFLDQQNFETIDINMGCPVRKVVKSGSGSAILKDLKRVYETTQAARKATSKPLSVKIRMGWDGHSKNYLEVGKAAEDAGADWITMHGRTRNDDYSVPVDINALAELKAHVSIPVIGNGNIMYVSDADKMLATSKVDGLMVSRGALGNPWLFRDLQAPSFSTSDKVSLDEWAGLVIDHLSWQKGQYINQTAAAVCMRKHLLWYLKGWPGARRWRDQINNASDLDSAVELVQQMVGSLRNEGVAYRGSLEEGVKGRERFFWEPKFDMDRVLDRGVGDDGGSSCG
ncbi:MAG: tRNA dihydrouridine synthase DusB [Bdellovibrionota bacterium]